MLAEGCQKIELIDCAGAVAYGSSLQQHTKAYHLDVRLDNITDATFDVTCVLVTLLRILKSDVLDSLKNVDDLARLIENIKDTEILRHAKRLYESKSFVKFLIE